MSVQAEQLIIRAKLPPKLMPLMDMGRRYRYYVARGGRGSAKSWSFARSLLLQGLKDPLRILCTREVQHTISDSVHHLLKTQIVLLGLEWFYTVQENKITGLNGCVIIFHGLSDLTADNLKSFEGIDIVWVEEGHKVTERSWRILIPTIRADGSEIWVSYNPELDTDATHIRFTDDVDDDMCIVDINYRDNPWFTGVSENDRQRDQRKLPEEDYLNIWEGVPRTSVPGAIYAKEISEMTKSKRIRNVPYDPTLPVHTIWDLGWNDQTSVGFVQKVVSEIRVIDYEEDSFLRPDEWAKKLGEKPYIYASHNLPHDGDHELQAAGGKSMKKILKPLLKLMPNIIPQPESVKVPIDAARLMFPRVYIDKTKCARLIECLKRFRRHVPKSTDEPALPVKDEYRHGADMFGYLGMIVDKLDNNAGRPLPKTEPWAQAVPGVM